MKKKIKGTGSKPRLYVFRSNKHIYAQVIDDTVNKVLVSKSSLAKKELGYTQSSANCATSTLVGCAIAKSCLQRGITQVVFDRGLKVYHGRIKALAEAARTEGIVF
uniref:Large ribosomal subunit protein uL18c n=1 Tax=Yamadaella caenomyce TaxID=259029 RepID=A0A1G4NYS7_9FLOR|nr:Ribosomal protein L18 [Yamadaella caenomyce]SCW23851.1 Ribosomal protein L18 [Yamadaella caenomyce]